MTNNTIATYDKYHGVYDSETIEFWDKFPKGVIDEFVKNIGGKRVLNLGSGPGRDALLLRDRGLEVVCLDASREMVSRTEQLGFESIRADMRELEFAIESYDGVWAYTSLLHLNIHETELVIAKVRKLLTDKGVFALGMIEGSFDGEVERESMPGLKRYFKYYTQDALVSMVEKIGFELVFQSEYKPHQKVYLNQIFTVAA